MRFNNYQVLKMSIDNILEGGTSCFWRAWFNSGCKITYTGTKKIPPNLISHCTICRSRIFAVIVVNTDLVLESVSKM